MALALAAIAIVACDRNEDGMREWTPRDHDHQGTPSAGQVDTSQQRPAALEQHGVSDVILASWKQNCVTCHGVVGRGDGPQGPMVRPPDFTNPVWQKNARDDHMRRTITKGRGPMPAFGHLPEETVDGLVRLIRLLNRDRAAAPQQPENAGPAAPTTAAPTTAAPTTAAPTTAAPTTAAPTTAAPTQNRP